MADEMMEDRVNVEASRSTDELYESSDANHASTQTKEINGNYSMTVAVKEINRSNFFQSWQGILEAIKSSTFLAMDLVRNCELYYYFILSECHSNGHNRYIVPTEVISRVIYQKLDQIKSLRVLINH